MNYSYDDIKKMENSAMDRVRRMQQREKELAKQMNEDLNGGFHSHPEPPKKGINKQPPKPEKGKTDNSPHPKHTRMPVNLNNIGKSLNNLFPPVSGDGDSRIILALLLLLSQEGADMITLLALVYILM